MIENKTEVSKDLEKALQTLEQAKARVANEKKKQNEKRRKAENHHKYIMGGIIVKYFCKSEKSAQRTLENIIPFIEGKLFLKLNREKTEVANISKVKYLGYSFYRYKGKCRFRVHPHSLEHEHILSGLIKCPICGTGPVGTLRRRKNKKSDEYKDDFYYKCLHRKKIDETNFCNFRLVLSQDEINHQVEEIILDMVADPDFKDYMVRKIDEKVDVSSLEAEREQVREQSDRSWERRRN